MMVIALRMTVEIGRLSKISKTVRRINRQTITTALNPTISQKSEDGHIHLNVVTVL